MTISSNLLAAYRHHRTHVAVVPRGTDYKGRRAALALYLAREDEAQGVKRYGAKATQGRLMFVTASATEKAQHDWRKQELTFVEEPSAIGLRCVGWCDDIAPIRHKGWYTSDSQSETYRGVVFQLPARDGCAVYVAGYQELEDGENMTGGYLVALRPKDWKHANRGEDESYDPSDARLRAARDADHFAENYAEKERDCQEAYRLGADYAEAMDESRGYRQKRRKLMASLAAARRDMNKLPVKSPWVTEICVKMWEDITALKESAKQAYDKAQEIISSNPYLDKDAFNDGAGSHAI